MVSYGAGVQTDVFKALADASRRRLLDALREQGGLDVTALAGVLPHLSRFTVAKHLGVLVQAGLVTVAADGRHRRHHLNPVPLQELHARWLGRFTATGAQTLVDLRTHLEQENAMPTPTTTPTEPGVTAVFAIVIGCDAQRLWEALTATGAPRPWMHGMSADLDTQGWDVGAFYTFTSEGHEVIVGEVVEVDAPHRLVLTFDARWDEEVTGEAPAQLAYDLAQERGATTLTVTMSGMGPATAASAQEGNIEMYSALKSLIETDRPLREG